MTHRQIIRNLIWLDPGTLAVSTIDNKRVVVEDLLELDLRHTLIIAHDIPPFLST